MNTLLFISLLVPCFSLYDHYNERSYARYKYYEKEKRTTFRYRPFQPMERIRKYQYRQFKSSSPLREGYDVDYKMKKLDQIHTNLTMSYFSPLNNSQIGATKIEESKYPWIASVFHSPNETYQYICTAACIENRIFITAARCIAQGQVTYMNVRYQNQILKPIALVIPSEPTKQSFDDIGFIIVDKTYSGNWPNVEIRTDIKRADEGDENFKWLAEYEIKNGFQYGTAIGYVFEPDVEIALYEIGKVVVSDYLCHELLFDYNNTIGTYFVPCYHPCDLDETARGEDKCTVYLAGEGHIVIGFNSKKLIGIATWGSRWEVRSSPLPVGLAMANSKSYTEDYECAKTIRDAPQSSTGQYAHLCETRRINGY